MSLDRFFKRWDARYGIPRPAGALHLDPYQAGLRLMRDAGEGAALLAAGCASGFIWWKIADLLLRIGLETHFYMIFAVIVCVSIGLLEALSLAIPYYRLTQRVTYGSARWAEGSELKEAGLAHDNRRELPPGALRIGRLTRRYDLALPFQQVLCHAAIFGPPGSGKSRSFFMPMARDWARNGSAIFLDPKGELFKHTAGHFRRVYRLDLADPRMSDRWNFVPACRGDAEISHEIASIIVGYDANQRVGYDPFWPQAETALLTALLLHLPLIAENPTPAHLAEFIGANDFDRIGKEMMDSPDPEARIKWGIFKKADREKTQGGVYIGLGTKLDPFRSPHAMKVLRSVSDEERERGLQEIDLYDMRRPGTGIYVVVPEGDATRYRIILSILFGLSASVARKTGDDERGAPMLLVLDEAGNIPLHNLSEALGVGRGRRCGIVLGYQNIGQLYKQYGRDGAQAILGSIGGMVFLPGLDAETAQYAARRIGRTTALQHRVVDATGATYDHEGLTETGRDLIDAAEIRQMATHTQAVGIFGSAPPIKFGFPPLVVDGPRYHPLSRETTSPVTLAEAIEAAKRRAEESKESASATTPASSPSPRVAASRTQASEGAMGAGADPSRGETSPAQSGAGVPSSPHMAEGADDVEFASDEDLGDSDKSIDSTIGGILDALPSPGARIIRNPNSPPSHVAELETDAGASPETSAGAARIDADSVHATGALDILDADVEKPPAGESGQLTLGWGPGDPGPETATAAPGAGKGGQQ